MNIRATSESIACPPPSGTTPLEGESAGDDGTTGAAAQALDAGPIIDALAYAACGWHVFPLHSLRADGRCTCPDVDCPPRKRGKHPRTTHGLSDATTDPARIRGWWRAWPDARVGISCGPSGLCVVDLDIGDGKDGEAAFAALRGLELDGADLIASTPRGGRHLIFAMPPGEPVTSTGGKIGRGIDTRAHGGYIVAPSAASPDREWLVGEPGDALSPPLPWLDALLPRASTTRETAPNSAPPSSTGARSDSGIALDLLPETVARIRSALVFVCNDEREDWLKVGMALKSTGAQQQAYDLWVEWSRSTANSALFQEHPGDHPKFDAADQMRVWRSLSKFFADGTEITIATLFWLAQEHGWQGVAIVPTATTGDAAPAPEPSPIAEHTRTLDAGLLSRRPPPRDYLLRAATYDGEPVPRGVDGDGWIPTGIVGLLSSEGGVGKTQLLLGLALAVITGRDWLGYRVARERVGQRVLLVLAEETAAEVHRRLWAQAEHLELGEDERRLVEQRLVVAPLAGHPCALVAAVRDSFGRTAHYGALHDLLARGAEPWALVVLDPLARMFPDGETGNPAATFAIQTAESLCRAPGAPLVLCAHHSSKESRRSGGADARGVTGLTDGARWAVTLAVGPGRHVTLSPQKSNYGPPTASITLTRERGGVLRLASTTECSAAEDAIGEIVATRAAATLAALVEALRLAESNGHRAKSKKAIAAIARRRLSDVGPAVDLGLSTGAIVRRTDPEYGVWFAVGDGNATPDSDVDDGPDDDQSTSARGPHTPRERGNAVPLADAGTATRVPGTLGNAREPGNAEYLYEPVPPVDEPIPTRRRRRKKTTKKKRARKSGGRADA
ncbi:MAG: bifunctional DNA primase/polymerase [Planctomycetes bacterium]|nr:bifunctional DNA primase/polymerase [Planctomycetota bacterium]